MKRKSAARANWQRIKTRQFIVQRIDAPNYHGYATLLRLHEVAEPLYVTFGQQQVCIADNNYDWLQLFPDSTRYILLAAFDPQGELVQWYIDIVLRTGVDEHGNPWYDDLYLDIVVSPEGETLLLDVDELDQALQEGLVSQGEYDLAWREASTLLSALEEDMFPLLWLCDAYREQLAQQLPV